MSQAPASISHTPIFYIHPKELNNTLYDVEELSLNGRISNLLKTLETPSEHKTYVHTETCCAFIPRHIEEAIARATTEAHLEYAELLGDTQAAALNANMHHHHVDNRRLSDMLKAARATAHVRTQATSLQSLPQTNPPTDTDSWIWAFSPTSGWGWYKLPRQHPHPTPAPTPAPSQDRSLSIQKIYNAGHRESLPGTLLTAPYTDQAASRALAGTAATYKLYSEVYKRDSLDGKGMTLISTVNFGVGYNNAYWQGSQMVYGNGDGRIFTDFTSDLDVEGHELTHGFTQHTVGLTYQNEAGGLNEFHSDFVGAQVKQRVKNQTADTADWLVGDQVLIGPGALRNMLKPGTGYTNHPILGNDPQISHMSQFKKGMDPHISSGIANAALSNACVEVGGHTWETLGPVVFDVMTNGSIGPNCTFAQFATASIYSVIKIKGTDSKEHKALVRGWRNVGVIS